MTREAACNKPYIPGEDREPHEEEKVPAAPPCSPSRTRNPRDYIREPAPWDRFPWPAIPQPLCPPWDTPPKIQISPGPFGRPPLPHYYPDGMVFTSGYGQTLTNGAHIDHF
jgi:hypothetical protein